MRVIAGLAAVVLGLASASAAAAESSVSAVTLQALAPSDPPQRIDLEGVHHPLPLTGTNGAYTGQYTPNADDAYLTSARLVATYPDGATAALAIRLWPGMPDVFVRFSRPKVTACDDGSLAIAERPAGKNLENGLQSYFMSQALFGLASPQACSPAQHKRAAKAWFDRAYDLTTAATYVDLSPEASDAESYFNAAHVRKFQAYSDGAAFKIIYQQKLAADGSKHYELAELLSQALLRQVANDPRMAAAMAGQSINVALLRSEENLIQTHLAQSGKATATTPPPPTTFEVGPHPDAHP
jgi:hypothetical protein